MYTLSVPSGTLRLDGVEIPQDDSKPAYITYALWLAAGNGPVMIADQEEPVIRPHITVSAWQLRKALNSNGMRDVVQSIVDNSGDINIKDGWEYAAEFDSDHPLLINMLPYLGIDEDAMYVIFEQAREM